MKRFIKNDKIGWCIFVLISNIDSLMTSPTRDEKVYQKYQNQTHTTTVERFYQKYQNRLVYFRTIYTLLEPGNLNIRASIWSCRSTSFAVVSINSSSLHSVADVSLALVWFSAIAWVYIVLVLLSMLFRVGRIWW